MLNPETIQKALERYRDVQGGRYFFETLRYRTIDPLPFREVAQLPQRARQLIDSVYILADYQPPLFEAPTTSQFRIYHVNLNTDRLRRTDFRIILDAFYRHFPQGNNLFVFTASVRSYRELAFVSPQRLLQRRPTDDQERITVRLRTLRVIPTEPYRTDLEILNEIALPSPDLSPEAIWQKHESAFNIERVTERFFKEYRTALNCLMDILEPREEAKPRSRRFAFAQLFLNRLMVCYFLARKGWLKDENAQPQRRYFRWLWGLYRQQPTKDGFYGWLKVLFEHAFNNELKTVSSAPLPDPVRRSFLKMPFLNGGLFARLEPDEYGYQVPDAAFSDYLFGDDPDGDPKFLERYNFTVDESRPYDEEVAVDPEMLGKVYESLIAKEERGEAGIFYTPRLEVDLMCRLSILELLRQRLRLKYDHLAGFVFTPNALEHHCPFSHSELIAIEKTLKEVRIVDPAVGSGSFLVGMLNVLCELMDALAFKLERKLYDRFNLKRDLILHNLYGVDVKDWAVRACELRLFLSLLVELPDSQPSEQANRPILPNLNFRIRIGDSLVQEVPSIPLPLILRHQNRIALPIQNRLKQLAEKKRELETTPPTQLSQKEQEIFAEERKVIADLLKQSCLNLEREIVQLQNEATTSRHSKSSQKELERKRQLLQDIRKQRERLLRGEPVPLFLWEVAFPEIFFNDDADQCGFDIVIANPPYVRQERIAPPTDLSPQDYKAAIQRNISDLWKGDAEVPGRADLYVPFFYSGAALLKPGGVLCLVTSNAWLDVDYGRAVQAFLLSKTRFRMVIDNLAKRTFAQSDVNTVITLAVRPRDGESVWDNPVRFVAFRVPFENLSPDLMTIALWEMDEAADRKQTPEYRVTPKTQKELWLEGATDEELQQESLAELAQSRYTGNKLGGKYLRAPDIFFTILEKGQGKLVRLGDIAEVRRGIMTGANEFFYLEPIGMTVAQVTKLAEKSPMTPVRVKNGAGWEGEIEASWLRPVTQSTREIKTLWVRLEDLHYLLFMPPAEVRDAIKKNQKPPLDRYPKAAAYIRWGEKQGYPSRPTCAARKPWWNLGEQEQQNFIVLRFRDERNWTPLLEAGYSVGDVVFVGKYKEQEYANEFNSLLNCTLHLLSTEIMGRVNLGEGLLTTYGPEIPHFITLHPSFLTPQRERLQKAFEEMSRRDVKSIFEELGFEICRQRKCEHSEHPYEFVKPEQLTLEQVQQASPDRFELDSIVFDVLGLTDEERLEVYKAIAELVKTRLVKAKSVERKREHR